MQVQQDEVMHIFVDANKPYKGDCMFCPIIRQVFFAKNTFLKTRDML